MITFSQFTKRDIVKAQGAKHNYTRSLPYVDKDQVLKGKSMRLNESPKHLKPLTYQYSVPVLLEPSNVKQNKATMHYLTEQKKEQEAAVKRETIKRKAIV